MATTSNILGAKKGQKGQHDFFCDKCDFISCKKYSWDRHILTAKHVKATGSNILATKKGQKGQKVIIYACENCNKEYNDRTGLWRHKKNCKINTTHLEEKFEKKDEYPDKEIIMMLIKDNSELKNMVLDVCQKIQPINSTVNYNNNINSNNKTFNLNLFLNETCKDAMNITDFVDSLKLQLSDLENVGKLGFVNGISNIIVKNLNSLDETKRPIHCSDSKREVMYIKDEDKWEKENEEKNKLRKVIKKIANKNSRLLPQFKEKYPDCNKSESKYSDQYNKLIIEAMGGSGDNDLEKEDKIIKNIAKEVTIDKNLY